MIEFTYNKRNGNDIVDVLSYAENAIVQITSFFASANVRRHFMEKPYRTHHTELTEDELLIADMLATLGPVWYGALPQRAYQFHMNLRYTHGVSDDDLPKMLDQMEIDGLLKSSPQSVHPPQFQYQLTIKGGDLWEAERLPIWQR